MSDQHMKCVSLTFGWKILGNIERTEGPMRYTFFFLNPAGYCGGSPVPPMDAQVSRANGHCSTKY